LTRTGKLIGEIDMLIAAHAIAADAVLVTNNTRHFKRIKLPLMMANWVQ
jgi:tRNA(fMet)-specific endonuclease VapC